MELQYFEISDMLIIVRIGLYESIYMNRFVWTGLQEVIYMNRFVWTGLHELVRMNGFAI